MSERPSPDLIISQIPDSLPQIPVETAWAIDVDRTLSSVTAVMNRLTSLGEDYGVPSAEILQAHKNAKDKEQVFDPLGQYRTRLASHEYDELCTKFNSPGLEPIIYDDTAHFLGHLAGPRVILTYAQQAHFQRIKLQAIPYQGYAHILDHTSKGPVIQSWRSDNGTFSFLGVSKHGKPLAVYNAARVNLVDDNSLSHEGLPQESTGYFLRRPNEQGAHEDPESIPKNVVTVTSLDQIKHEPVDTTDHGVEEPFAFIPLAEMHKPLRWLGNTMITSLTEGELRDRTA